MSLSYAGLSNKSCAHMAHMATPHVSTGHQNRLGAGDSSVSAAAQPTTRSLVAVGRSGIRRGQRTNKPMFVSIGYAACHWCHVMAHESFEDDATARVMNELFVNIKVDREERPDIDRSTWPRCISWASGGWPLTMFLTPGGEPIWGGTYFPRLALRQAGLRQGAARSRAAVTRGAGEDEHNRGALLARWPERHSRPTPGRSARRDRDAARLFGGMIDPVNGGLRGAPKSPKLPSSAPVARRLPNGRAGHSPASRSPSTASPRAGSTTISAVAIPGIRSTTGGSCGVSRKCSTTTRSCSSCWRSRTGGQASRLSPARPRNRRVAHPRNDPSRGSVSAPLDADCEGEEGKFYVWTEAEVMRARRRRRRVFRPAL